jgi:hypothetical protein
VSFLNITRGVLSSSDNFLLFGANCDESCIPVRRFINMLHNDMKTVERNVYPLNINGTTVNVKFIYFSELPNYMKMLAFLGGELTNSTQTITNLNGTFGTQANDTWKHWQYSQRLKVAKEVENLKLTLSKKKLAPSTKRTRVTQFIASKRSRQEFVPLVGNIIDRAHVEPLHLKNNACALAHRYLLHEVMAMSNLTNNITLYAQVPITSLFRKYVETLRNKCKLSRLSRE